MGKKTVIVGAGIAGLTLACLLAKEKKDVIVVERDTKVGGLCRSFHYGDLMFDIGPKRFHTDDQSILNFIYDILGDDYITIPRSSSVYLFDKYFSWPLSTQAIFKLPPLIMIKAALDMIFKKASEDNISFSNYTISKYGKTLYNCFFKNYTEKFLKMPCELVHADWAKTGVNRAVIDKKVKSDTLFDLAKGVLLPKPVETNFLYPSYGGLGAFCDKMRDRAEGLGVEFLLEKEVTKLNVKDSAIESIDLKSGEHFDIEDLIWSGNLLDAMRLLNISPPPIKYLSTIFYNMKITGELLQDWQWCYFGSSDTKILRVSLPKSFAAYAAPEGISSAIVEVTCYQGDDTWQNPENLVEELKSDLEKVGLVPDKKLITECYIEKVKDTYPVYDMKYRENYEAITNSLSPFKNLKLLGRTGAYWYNNIDHSIKMSMDMADTIVKGTKMQEKDEYFKF